MEPKVYWRRAAHCSICDQGYEGEGALQLAIACHDRGYPDFKFERGCCVRFKGKKHLWRVVKRYIVNAKALSPFTNVKSGHVKVYDLQSCQYPNKPLKVAVREVALEEFACE